MPLKFPGAWRFSRTPDKLPDAARLEFDDLIGKVVLQGNRWQLIEHFKGAFVRSIGASHVWSSSEDWADTDLRDYMQHASKNTPLFLEALYDAFEDLRGRGFDVPDVDIINDICREHAVPYQIRPPALVRTSGVKEMAVPVPAAPPTLAENAANLVQESSRRSEQLLAEGRPREAVQEVLWMLESLVTVFRGTSVAGAEVRGKYFNDIARELRLAGAGTTLGQVIQWCTQLHGYLSSPTGGGVRHGLDLNAGTPITQAEGRLFCNLILSYITFLLGEHERLLTDTV